MDEPGVGSELPVTVWARQHYHSDSILPIDKASGNYLFKPKRTALGLLGTLLG